jgi:hypothetical protein
MRIHAELAYEAEASESQRGDHSRSMVLLESLSHVPMPYHCYKAISLSKAAETPFFAPSLSRPNCFLLSVHGVAFTRWFLHFLVPYLADELALPLLQLSSTPASIPEERNSFFHVTAADDTVLASSRSSQNASRSEKLQRISQTDVHTLSSQLFKSLRAQRRSHSESFRSS